MTPSKVIYDYLNALMESNEFITSKNIIDHSFQCLNEKCFFPEKQLLKNKVMYHIILLLYNITMDNLESSEKQRQGKPYSSITQI